MYKAGTKKKPGTATKVGKIYRSPAHIFNKPHGLIAASYHPKVTDVQSRDKEDETSN